MKKIAFIVRDLAGGGVERTLFNLMSAIDKTKYAVTLLVFSNTGKMVSEIPNGVKVVDLSLMHYRFGRVMFESKRDFLRLMKKGKIISAVDLAIFDRKSNQIAAKQGGEAMYHYYAKKIPALRETFDLAVDFYGYGDYTGAYVIDKITAKKKATWIHDENQSWTKAMVGYYPKFDKIFACSKRCADNFCRTFPQLTEKVEVLYNLIPVDMIRQMAKNDIPRLSERTNLLTVGRLSKQKGYDIAIEAAKLMKRKNVSFTWYFVGSGVEEAALKQMVRQYGLEDQIVFCGFDLNPYRYMTACDLYVQPSRHEGYCTTITEAFVLGKAIVAADVSGVREQIIHKQTGWILEEITPECIAETLEMLINDSDKRKDIQRTVAEKSVDFDSELEKLYALVSGEKEDE